MRAFTHRTTRTFALAGVVTATGLLLAACGTEDGAGGMDHGGASASATASATAAPGTTAAPEAGAPGAFDDADVMFAQMMIPHHEQALEMAKLAEGRAEDPEVKRLVTAIEQAQDPEIQKMRAWLKGWGRPESAAHGSGHGMSGMMSGQDMKDLAAVKGRAFDRKFAELMIAHHEGAVAMAKDEQRDGRNATARKLADDVVRTQSTEVAQLRKILDRL
ncbi:DUF305 domain-containing protein [Streptomyces sp. SP18ES09]|uniref:DUF305 domain-containing protein n=1 Tax=Streptomyces sp. SP18ES09 TaxID=3002532 RepID=UPI002E75F1D9|nr:DUF305 domain-containing protein [Streptomyces sp. SP18ES09]MEE1815457.1 DUF305 domain-containing protein [Streptomyces sp. SP18ES09]